MPEPLLSGAKARAILGRLKSCKRIDHDTLIHLVKKEGLPKHDDPFGSGHWCFLESELYAWYASRLAGVKPALRGPGRPSTSTNRAPEHRQVPGGSLPER